MSRPMVLLVTLAVLAVLATLPLVKGNEGEGRAALAKDTNARAWPCCDKCGYCLLMYQPKCNCMDISERGCHPACRNCVRYTADSGFSQEPPVYRCVDVHELLPAPLHACSGCCGVTWGCGHLNASNR